MVLPRPQRAGRDALVDEFGEGAAGARGHVLRRVIDGAGEARVRGEAAAAAAAGAALARVEDDALDAALEEAAR